MTHQMDWFWLNDQSDLLSRVFDKGDGYDTDLVPGSREVGRYELIK